jgi:hypothetical protein
MWSRAAFHRLVDCVVPNFELYELAAAQNRADTALVVPEAQRDFLDVLLPAAGPRKAQVHYLPRDKDCNRSCLLVGNRAVVTYETRTLGPREEQRARAARFRAAMLRVHRDQVPP